MNKIKVGFIGTGNMGSAIIRGIASKFGADAEIHAFDVDAEKLAKLAESGVKPESSECDVVKTCKYVFLAIKPQMFEAVVPKLAAAVTDETVIVSIAAGITEEYIRSQTGDGTKVVLVMPNTPFLLGEGASALAKGDNTSDEEFDVVCSIFATGGKTAVVSKDKMKEIIAVNGSSPAFIYLYAKYFIDYAASVGIDAEAAKELFAQSLIGSAKMMTDSGYTMDELIKMVSSPGGTTLAGLDELYKADLADAVKKCCESCTRRAYELSK